MVENNSEVHAHNGSGFDTWIIINNLPCDKKIVEFFKKGKDIISLRVFNGYIQNKKTQILQYPIFRCGMT